MTKQRTNTGEADWLSPYWPFDGKSTTGLPKAADNRQLHFARAVPRNDSQNGDTDGGEPVGSVLRGFLGLGVRRIPPP